MSLSFAKAREWYMSGMRVPMGELLLWAKSSDQNMRALAYEAATSRRPSELLEEERADWRRIVVPYAVYVMATGITDAMEHSPGDCILDLVSELGAACSRGDSELATDLRDALALVCKCRPDYCDAIIEHGLEHWLTRPNVVGLFEAWDHDPRLRPMLVETRRMLNAGNTELDRPDKERESRQ